MLSVQNNILAVANEPERRMNMLVQEMNEFTSLMTDASSKRSVLLDIEISESSSSESDFEAISTCDQVCEDEQSPNDDRFIY